MTIWPPRPQDLRRPAYRSLAEAVLRAVEAGELRPGDRMPTHRQLAFDLDLSVQTVSRAYEELIRRGAVTGEVGRGTFVAASMEETKTPYLPERQYGAIIDCSILKPVFEDIHSEAMQKALADLSKDLPSNVVSSFRPNVSNLKYRETAEIWLALCGLKPNRQGVLPTNGNTSAMTISLMTAAAAGDLIVSEQLSHHTLKPMAEYLGLRLRGLEMDDEGMRPQALVEACEGGAVKLVYLMPSGLNPRANLMSLRRREQLAEIARHYNLLIVENDAWGPLGVGRPAPLAQIAPERTFYFTSLTKCIMPGLRSGFLVMPDAYESAVANRHLVTNWMATPLMAEIASRWIADGTALNLLEWQRDALGERNRTAARVLGDLPHSASSNGMHIWIPLPSGWTEDDFVSQARMHGVAIAPGSSFAMDREHFSPGVRLCLGAAARSELEQGLRIIARLLRTRPEPALDAI